MIPQASASVIFKISEKTANVGQLCVALILGGLEARSIYKHYLQIYSIGLFVSKCEVVSYKYM